MATGLEMKEVYDLMKRICIETSNLLKVINDLFEEEGFEAVGGSAVMWERSNHYRYPEYWLPYFMQRVFVKEEGSRKGIGINIMFDGSMHGLKNRIPFVTCGLLEVQDGEAGKSDALYLAGWEDDAGTVKRQLDEPFSIDKFKDYGGVEITSYFLPLDVLNNREKVKQFIIQPLSHLLNGEQDEARSLIGQVAIGMNEILG